MKSILRYILSMLPLALSAAPFEQWFPGTSPNGAAVQVWGWGDEYSVRYEAEDGHAVVKDPVSRTYFYARQEAGGALVSTGIAVGDETDADLATLAAIPLHQVDTSAAAQEERAARILRDDLETGRAARWEKQKERARKIREAEKNGLFMAPPDNPTAGTVRGITVLIDFPIDGSSETTWSSVHPGVTAAQLDQLLNGENCSLYGNASSVHSYYYDVSNGRLDYTMAVIGPIMAPKPRSYYDDPKRDNGECARELMDDVFKVIWADANFTTRYLPLLQSLSTLDGKVRSLNFWFAGEKATEWSQGLWAHKWSVSDAFANDYAFTVGGKTVKFDTYQITPIQKSPGIYTFCHENGHMLCGFPDLYNYEKSVDGNRGVGYFSLMYGSLNKLNPPFFDPYLRAAAGWVEPQLLPTSGGTVTVRSNHADVWKYENPSNPLEYYLIENRQKTGRDANIAASGILVWRCNEAGNNAHPKPVGELSGFGSSVHRWNYELSLEQADGRYDIEQNKNTGDSSDAWYNGNSDSKGVFNDNSQPTAKWVDASPSGLSLKNFSSNGDTMTFEVAAYSGDMPTVPLAEALDAMELEFSTSAKFGWHGQKSKANYGGSATKSGAIGNSQSTWMQTSVTGPGTLSFDWMVSSEKGYDFLKFAIDGVENAKISGSTSWSTKTYSIPDGQHAVSWSYSKDYSNGSGDDAGYVDHVVWKPDAKVAKPVISGPSGADFMPPATVGISCATEGATIRYTLDGSDPTEGSAAYSQPLVIKGDVEIRARAFKNGMAPSAIASAAYFRRKNLNEIFQTEGIEWKNDSEVPWREEGVRTMRAGGLEGETAYVSKLTATVRGRGTLKFAYKIVSSSYNNTALFKMDSTTLFKTSSSGTYENEIVREVKSTSGATFTWTLTVNSPSYDYDDRGIWLSDVVWEPADVAATPVIDGPQLALFNGPVDVSVSCATAGATMRYTLDGSDPTEESAAVSGGRITILEASTLKVRAFKSGLGGSGVATARYAIKAEPGKFTNDAELVRLSAAADGKLVVFVRADCGNSLWPYFTQAVDTRNFQRWAMENSVYFVLLDDSDVAHPEYLTSWWTRLGDRGTTTTDGNLIPQFYLLNPLNCEKAVASAYALNGYPIGSVKFARTTSSLISGIISLLEGKGIELESCPTDNPAVAFKIPDVTWINDPDVPWTEITSDGAMRTGGFMDTKYESTLTARVHGAGTFRFSYRVCSFSNDNKASYAVNGNVVKTIGKTDVAYATDDVVIEVGPGDNEISWTYSVEAADMDYSAGYTYSKKSAWCGMWLSNVSWEARPDPVATPVIAGPEVALIDGYLDVGVSCATEGATLRYTLDGSDPTEASPVLSNGTIRLTDDATLKVRAYRDGMGPSAVASARYLKKAEPGVWTTDAERVRLSAAVDGRMVCVARLSATLPHWSELSPILNSGEFLAWAAANGIYLVMWDSNADSSGTSESATWLKALYAQRGTGSLYNWEMCFALPTAPDVLCGYARAYGSYSVGSVKYDKTVPGMIAGFASILSDNGLIPIAPEVAAVVALLDGKDGEVEHDAAVMKIHAIAAGENPAVAPEALLAWIAGNDLGSADIAYSDFIVASVKLGTSLPITGDAEVKFVKVETGAAGNGFTFKFELTLSGEYSPEKLAYEREAIAACIETTCNVADGFHETIATSRVAIGNDGSVTIAPVPNRSSEFFRINIPMDPGAQQ